MSVSNTEKYVGKAIKSILKQSFSDFEFIIIDDASTDRSLEIINHHKNKDPRIIIITNDVNLGISQSRNKGLEIAQGRFIGVMDSDDISLKNRFLKQVEFLENNTDYVGVGTNTLHIDPEGFPFRKVDHPSTNDEINTQLLLGNGDAITHGSFLCRTNIVNDLGGYDESFINVVDLDLFLRLAEKGKLSNLREILYKVRFREQSIGHQKSSLWKDNILKALTKTMQRRNIEINLTDIEIGGLHQDDYRLYWAYTAYRYLNLHTTIKNFIISIANNGIQKTHLDFMKLMFNDGRGWSRRIFLK